MLIEVLCEDRSSEEVLAHFLGESLKRRRQRHRLMIHPHRGLGYLPHNLQERPETNKTGLYDLLPAKLRAYEKLSSRYDILLVVVHDADQTDPDFYYQRLEFLIRHLCPHAFFVIGISVEEMEAWLLGDPEAILAAYPQADRAIWENYTQDSVCGTWERLAYMIEGPKKGRSLVDLGYPAVGIYKGEWARKIAPYLQLDRNRSPSLHTFMRRFEQILSRAEQASPAS